MTPTPQGAAPLPEALRLAELMEQTSCDQKLPLETRQLAFVVCLELRRLHAVSAAAPAAPAIRQWPPVSGVGRDDGHARALMVYFSAVPTDGEMRAVQDALQAQQPTAPDLQRLHDMLYAAQRQTSMDGMHGAITAARIELSNLMAAPTAPQAGAPAVDYVPMLDDDGRAMVGTSHHYTAENIRSLVSKYKAIERGDPDALALLANEDWRTQAGVLHRVIAALADEVPFAQPQAGAESYPPLPPGDRYSRTGNITDLGWYDLHAMRAFAEATAALRARGAVPSGWKLVPLRVNNNMIDAANDTPTGIGGSPPHWQHVWDQMLCAAPEYKGGQG